MSFSYTLTSPRSQQCSCQDSRSIVKPLRDNSKFKRDISEHNSPIDRVTSLSTFCCRVCGAPIPGQRTWNVLNFTMNTGLGLLIIDAIYTTPYLYPVTDLSFARVGYVSDNSANILIREPRANLVPLSLSYRQVETNKDLVLDESITRTLWTSIETVSVPLSEDTDFTAAFHLENLEPDVIYQYATSNDKSGLFKTAPSVGQLSKLLQKKYNFLHSSCMIPRFPYKFSHPLHIPGLRHVAAWITRLNPYFMLFLGDFIYVDVPFRMGSDIEAYRREYRQVYASPDWYAASRTLPWIHVLDDHEIANDWHSNTTGIYSSAVDPWQHYHVSVNPPRVRSGETYFSFIQGPAMFFMMDTRRYRSSNFFANYNDPSKTMLGATQLNDLLQFLRTPSPDGVYWKFVISSVPFTKNWRFGEEDVWGGFLFERRKILEAMWDAGLEDGVGVVVLSGDRHEFAATAFPPPMSGRWPVNVTVHEFSASPLSMFYLPTRTYKQRDDEDICLKCV